MKLLLPVIVLLSGCYTYHVGERTSVLDSDLLAFVEDIQYEWSEDSTLPTQEDCNLSNLWIARPTDEQFITASYGFYCPDGGSIMTGCIFEVSAYLLAEQRLRPRSEVNYIIVIAQGVPDSALPTAIAHESVHWLSWCTGHSDVQRDGPASGDLYPNGDSGHKDTRLWGANGVLARAGF